MKYLTLLLTFCLFIPYAAAQNKPAIPVIFDTDIGDDIDDTWALALILASPELDLRMVVTDSHDTYAKAKIAAKFLQTVGRGKIPIGIGIKTSDKTGSQYPIAKDYDLADYPGQIHEDGIGAMIDMVNSATEEFTLLVVGPCPNIPELRRRAPDIESKLNVVAMSGSVETGYAENLTPDAEYNVRDNIPAAKSLYTGAWDLTIAPLDTAASVIIRDVTYQNLLRNLNPLIDTVLQNYRAWLDESKNTTPPDSRSTILYDTVAVYLAIEQEMCEMRDINLVVNDYGYTVKAPNGKTVHTAIRWKNLSNFETWVVDRLSSGVYDPKKDESNKPRRRFSTPVEQ